LRERIKTCTMLAWQGEACSMKGAIEDDTVINSVVNKRNEPNSDISPLSSDSARTSDNPQKQKF
jgi:hypothetical protein